MKTKILLLIIFSSLILGCCRSKHKVTTVSRENTHETEKVKTDSLGLRHSETVQNTSADLLSTEKTDEISGNISIKGKSDNSNPFVYHNIIGKDTLQSISILGNAEYTISNHYVKASHKKTENIKEKFTNTFQEKAQHALSKEIDRQKKSVISQETKKIKVTGFEIAAWIFLAIMGVTLILLFFTYKYFKK